MPPANQKRPREIGRLKFLGYALGVCEPAILGNPELQRLLSGITGAAPLEVGLKAARQRSVGKRRAAPVSEVGGVARRHVGMSAPSVLELASARFEDRDNEAAAYASASSAAASGDKVDLRSYGLDTRVDDLCQRQIVIYGMRLVRFVPKLPLHHLAAEMPDGEGHRLGTRRASDVVRGEALFIVLVRRAWIAEDAQWLYAVLSAHRHGLVNSGGNTVLALFLLDAPP